MGNIFLDTNKFIDLVQGRGNQNLSQQLNGHQVYISPLSAHIMFYLEKRAVPNFAANGTISQFQIVDFSKDILDKALTGPTHDLEDNVQLHSAAESGCDKFLTSDKELLKTRFFGKTEILDEVN